MYSTNCMPDGGNQTKITPDRCGQLSYGAQEQGYTPIRSKKIKGMISMGLVSLISLIINNSPPDNPVLNKPPVAKALFSHSVPIDQDNPTFVHPNKGVVLDGSCSYDPDGNYIEGSCSYVSDNPDGNYIGYVWSMKKIPAGSSLTDADILGRFGSHPIFYPDVPGDYTLELRVTDEKGASALDYITVSAQRGIPAEIQISPADNHQGAKKRPIVEEKKKKGHKILDPIKKLIRKK